MKDSFVIPSELYESEDEEVEHKEIELDTYDRCMYITQLDEAPSGIKPGEFESIVHVTRNQAALLVERLIEWINEPYMVEK